MRIVTAIRGTYAFVAGRWDSTVTVIDIDAALAGKPAIVGRVRSTSSAACALPVSICIDRRRGRILVVNHAGRASSEAVAAMPHGHSGTIAVLDLSRALAGQEALLAEIDAEGHGPVACVLTPDENFYLVTAAEGEGTEDGGCAIIVFDAATLEVSARCTLAHSGTPCRAPSPHDGFGRFPNPNGIAIVDHKDLVFTANGGRSDVSALRLSSVLSGAPDAEIGRVSVPSGPFGICADPAGALLATADRENAVTGELGNTVSLIEVSAAFTGDATAQAVLVGTAAEREGTRPFVPVFSKDGSELYVTCQASGTLSAVDVRAALAQRPGAERRIALRHPAGLSASPRGLAMTPDGRFLAVSGGPKAGPESGVVWLVSAADLTERGGISGVGNEPYLIVIEAF